MPCPFLFFFFFLFPPLSCSLRGFFRPRPQPQLAQQLIVAIVISTAIRPYGPYLGTQPALLLLNLPKTLLQALATTNPSVFLGLPRPCLASRTSCYSRFSKSACLLFKQRSSRGVWVSISRCRIGVALQVLATIRRLRFQAFVRPLVMPFSLPPTIIGVQKLNAPQAIVLRMHLVQTSLAFARLGPQVFVAILNRAKFQVLSFFSTAIAQAFQDSFQLSQTPRNLLEGIGLIVVQLAPKSQAKVTKLAYCRRLLLKQISSFFSAIKAILFIVAYYRQAFQALSSQLVQASVFLLKASRFVSLAKPTILTIGQFLFRALYSVAIQRIKRIGKRGEPQGILAFTVIFSVNYPSKQRIATRPNSQACSYTTSQLGKLKPYSIASSLVQLIVSNAPIISNYKRLTKIFQCNALIVYTSRQGLLQQTSTRVLQAGLKGG